MPARHHRPATHTKHYHQHYGSYEEDDGPGPFCAAAVVIIFIVTGIYFMISSTDTTRANKLKVFDAHVSNWTSIHRKDFSDTAFWVTSVVDFGGQVFDELSQSAPIQLVQKAIDEELKDSSPDVPVFDPLSHTLSQEIAPHFIKEVNFSGMNLSAPMPTVTFFIHTNEEQGTGLLRPSTAGLPSYKIPLFQWEQWGGVYISRTRKCKLLQKLHKVCFMIEPSLPGPLPTRSPTAEDTPSPTTVPRKLSAAKQEEEQAQGQEEARIAMQERAQDEEIAQQELREDGAGAQMGWSFSRHPLSGNARLVARSRARAARKRRAKAKARALSAKRKVEARAQKAARKGRGGKGKKAAQGDDNHNNGTSADADAPIYRPRGKKGKKYNKAARAHALADQAATEAEMEAFDVHKGVTYGCDPKQDWKVASYTRAKMPRRDPSQVGLTTFPHFQLSLRHAADPIAALKHVTGSQMHFGTPAGQQLTMGLSLVGFGFLLAVVCFYIFGYLNVDTAPPPLQKKAKKPSTSPTSGWSSSTLKGSRDATLNRRGKAKGSGRKKLQLSTPIEKRATTVPSPSNASQKEASDNMPAAETPSVPPIASSKPPPMINVSKSVPIVLPGARDTKSIDSEDVGFTEVPVKSGRGKGNKALKKSSSMSSEPKTLRKMGSSDSYLPM